MVVMIEEGREDALEKVQCGAQDDPLDTVLVTLAECLPHRLLLCRLPRDAYPRTAAVGPRRVLLNLPELDARRRDVMPGVGKVEHTPELRIGVGFRYFKKREISGVRRGKRKLVNGREDAGVGYCPFQVSGGFAADDLGRGRGCMTGV